MGDMRMTEFLKHIEEVPVGLDRSLVLEASHAYGKDPQRIVMEFIDNGFDAALKYELDKQKNDFEETLKIKVDVYDDAVHIRNNAQGLDMSEIKEAFKSIGLSNKKNDFVTNGEKGFGVYSFLPFAKTLTFNSKKDEKTDAVSMIIYRDRFEDGSKKLENTYAENTEFKEKGTQVILGGIDKKSMGKITRDRLTEYTSRHFTQKLKNYDCEILVNDNRLKEKTFKPLMCQPFDYKVIVGERLNFEYAIKDQKIKINIIISRDSHTKYNHYQLAVYRNNNRVNKLSELHGVTSQVWDNKGIYGEISVTQDFPIELTRTDFKADELNTKLYEYVNTELAAKVEAIFAEQLDLKRNSELGKMSQHLKEAMKHALSGLELIFDEKEKRKKYQIGKKTKKKKKDEENKTKRTPKKKQKGGTPDIDFSIGHPPIINGVPQRSQWVPRDDGPNLIVIFTKHEDFKLRQQTNSLKSKITLAGCGERTIHYISMIASRHLVNERWKQAKIEDTDIELESKMDLHDTSQLIIEDFLNKLAFTNGS